MTKRTDGKFVRRESDYYSTPASAVLPLMPHLDPNQKFCEPFAGHGSLAFALIDNGMTLGNWSDLEPKPQSRFSPIPKLDVMDVREEHVANSQIIITNSIWPMPRAGGEPTISVIHHLVALRPSWFLLSSDFAHNVYWEKVGGFCEKIVRVGRVSWMFNGKAGFDNAAWYLFNNDADGEYEWARFYGNT